MIYPLRRWLPCGAFLLLLPSLLLAERPFAFETTPGQLPKTVVPLHYALRIQPDLDKRTTTGTVDIDLDVRAPVKELVLNALELDITGVALADDAAAPQPLTATVDEAKQTLTVPVTLAPGRHALHIAFHGRIGTAAQGFFIDQYQTPSGATKRMLGTQMESTDARRAFPCWDEPVYRATFDITLVIPENLMGVSNMPIAKEEPAGEGLKAVTFARTPSMSTYLVAMYAAEFEAVEGEFDGVKIRVLTTEGKRESARYALEASQRVLAYYHDYFGVKYPLPKLDHIGVPHAFSGFGAMENWGCITYIDTDLLFDPATASQAGKERVFEVIAHEIAHQWFGNIVTMAWWDNIWLNEGFASWLETKATDVLNPSWQIGRRAVEEKERVMNLDARTNTHAILQSIATEGEAANAFDAISYEKGKAFLRMLETWLGEAPFRAGIRRYIRQHAYGNTTTADLWRAMDEATGRPVSAFATSWTERPGFPIVSVTTREESGQRRLVLRQTRFTFGPADPSTPPWPIPVTYATVSGIAQPVSVLFDQPEMTLPWPEGSGPVKLNVGNTAFYRVQYDEALAAELQSQAGDLPVDDQLNLLSDTWALAQAGRLVVTRYLDLANSLTDSDDPTVIEGILDKLGHIDALEEGRPGRRAFQRWACTVLQPLIDKLGRDARPGEPPLTTSLRAEVLEHLGTFGDEATIAWASARFQAYRQDPSSLPGNLADAVFNTVGRYADRATYDQLHEIARTATSTLLKRRAYGAMRAALDPALTRATMALTLGDEMPASESNRNLESLTARSENKELVIDYAIAHFDELAKRIGNFELYSYLPEIMRGVADERQADRLMEFTKAKLPPDALPIAARQAESIRERSRFRERALPAIDGWVRDQLEQLPE